MRVSGSVYALVSRLLYNLDAYLSFMCSLLLIIDVYKSVGRNTKMS